MLFRYEPAHSRNRVPARTIPFDAVRRDDHVHLEFDLPGSRPDDIDLQVDKGVLKLRATRDWDHGDEVSTLARERWHGVRERWLRLGDDLDSDALDARYVDGVLTVTIPFVETASPRRIEISAAPAIEAEATAA